MTSPTPSPSPSLTPRKIAVTVGFVLTALGLSAAIATSSDTAQGAAAVDVASVDQTASVAITGEWLAAPNNPGFSADPATDSHIGGPSPVFTATSFTGEQVEPMNSKFGKVLVFVAHWCPHCQHDVPAIVELMNTGQVPDGVEVYAVSTAVDSGQGNYPPGPWLQNENWPLGASVRDNESSDLLEAFGGTGLPYIVFLNDRNEVVARNLGSISEADLLTGFGLAAS